MVELEINVTLERYIEAQKLFMRDVQRRLRWKRWILAAMIAIGLTMFIWAQARPLTFMREQPYIFAVLILFVPLLFPALYQKRYLKKRYVLEKQNMTNLQVVLDEEGFHARIPELGAGIARWASFNSWHESANTIVLRNGLAMRVLTKDTMTPAQLIETHALLNRHIGPLDIAKTS
jgi:hypothetical protein